MNYEGDYYMSDSFIGEDNIVTKIPYDIRVVRMSFHFDQDDEEKAAFIAGHLRPGELYSLDAIVKEAKVPVDAHDGNNNGYNPHYVQNVIFVKKKEF